jgi:hypothetical protein
MVECAGTAQHSDPKIINPKPRWSLSTCKLLNVLLNVILGIVQQETEKHAFLSREVLKIYKL